jgi:membrane protein DedA with SNARE-associated domain
MEHFLATWGYLALFAVTFISAMAIPIGSEIAIGYAGALASGQLTTSGHDHLHLALVIVVAALGEVVGSLTGYAIGRFGGRPLVDRVGKYILLTHKDLDRAEAWFDRRGEPFVLFGRFIPLLRSFVSLAAGLGEMALAKFLAFTVLGCVVWCAALASIGYSLGSSWHHVIKDFSFAGYVVGVLIVIGIVVVVLHRLSVVRAERAAHSAAGQRARAREDA